MSDLDDYDFSWLDDGFNDDGEGIEYDWSDDEIASILNRVTEIDEEMNGTDGVPVMAWVMLLLLAFVASVVGGVLSAIFVMMTLGGS